MGVAPATGGGYTASSEPTAVGPTARPRRVVESGPSGALRWATPSGGGGDALSWVIPRGAAGSEMSSPALGSPTDPGGIFDIDFPFQRRVNNRQPKSLALRP